MTKIGAIKVHTETGTVEVPLYAEGDSGSNIYEFLKVHTEQGTGFIPLAEPADAEYNYIRIQTEKNGAVAVHTETALGVAEIQNYIEDDWNDNKLTNRDNTQDGIYPTPQSFQSSDTSSNEYDQGKVAGDVLIGRDRPEWVINNGSDATGFQPQNELLEVILDESGSNDWSKVAASSSSKVTTGVWQMDFRWVNTNSGSGSYETGMEIISDTLDASSYGTGNAWMVRCSDESGEYRFTKVDSGSRSQIFTSSTNGNDGSWHTMKTTRDSYGDFEVIHDSSSEGTHTDTFLPENPQYFRLAGFTNNGRWYAEAHIDNLVVR